MRPLLSVVCCVAIFSQVTGCFYLQAALYEKDRNVTKNSEYWGEYEPGGIYELQEPVILAQTGKGQPYLMPVADWRETPLPQEEPKHKLGILPVGTKVQLKKITEHVRITHTRVSLSGQILDGQFTGTNVSLNELSKSIDYPKTYAPNHEFLLPVEVSERGVPLAER